MNESETKHQIISNFKHIQHRIKESLIKEGRNDDAHLLAVSKTKPAALIRTLWEQGQKDFGENYLQEAMDKICELSDCHDICWHFIGALQSNKTKLIAENFHWVHSVDRLKIAKRLNEQRPDNMPCLNVCIQLNISHEKTKSGLNNNDSLLTLAQSITSLSRLNLKGLMVIPAPLTKPDDQKAQFEEVSEKMSWLKKQLSLPGLDTLSMGMSADLEQAISAGSTMVRIGSALFGPR